MVASERTSKTVGPISPDLALAVRPSAPISPGFRKDLSEVCAIAMPGRSASQTKPAVAAFERSLLERIGADRYRMWFGSAEISEDAGELVVTAAGAFALERLKKNFGREIRAAAGVRAVRLTHVEPNHERSDQPSMFTEADAGETTARRPPPSRPATRRQRPGNQAGPSRRGVHRAGELVGSVEPRRRGATAASAPAAHKVAAPSASAPSPSTPSAAAMTFENFARSSCNAMAVAAATMLCSPAPGAATTPAGQTLFVSGPAGCGKTHLMSAVADALRRGKPRRTVIRTTAEQFTNEFVAVVGGGGITNFRGRYRDIDALLIDDVQFLSKKTATIREFHNTLETLQRAGKTVVLVSSLPPSSIDHLPGELVSRMSSGLVCEMSALDAACRKALLLRWIETRCPLAMPEETIDRCNAMLVGDGRVVGGLVNGVHLLQRMVGRTPTFDEINAHCGHLLRAGEGELNLNSIESAVCRYFGVRPEELRGGSQARRVTRPRMLAMYLSRQLTSAAFTEIASHFGVRSHTTAMAAGRNVKRWIDQNETIGRGDGSTPIGEAISKLETELRRSG